MAADRENNYTASKNKPSKEGKVIFIENSSNYLPFGIYDMNFRTNPLCSRPFGDYAI